MTQIRPLLALLAAVSCFSVPATCQTGAILSLVSARVRAIEEIRLVAVEDLAVPQEMASLMRRSQALYLEGADLLKSGETEKARELYDAAVDIVLQSEWSLSVTPDLANFFQDLVSRIKRDESLYLRPPQPTEDEPEKAVLDELESLDLIPIQVDPSLQDLVEADILTAKYDIPIVLNESVLKSLNYWVGRGKKYFADGLIRSGRYREMIHEVFQAESLPLDLMYLAQVESLFKTNALSRAAARGMWQFGRGTAIRYGLKVNRQVDERMDPEKSTRAAARYLKDLYAMFQDWDLVLAAYNWGEGKVQALINKHKKNDFWDLTGLRRGFPKETKKHIPLIHSSIILARNPEKYGLPVDLDPPLRYARVQIPRRTSLAAISKTLGASVDTLKRLNPSLRTAYTPSGYSGFELYIPEDADPSLVERLASLPAAKSAPVESSEGRYRVRPGDTLWLIASRHRTTVSVLQEMNDIQSPRALRAGSWIEVPNRTPASKRTANGAPKGGSEAANAATKP